jgi:hypothetical protein
MTRISAERVKAKLDTHEAVCAERWKETILRIKRLEAIFIAFSGATIQVMLLEELTMTRKRKEKHYEKIWVCYKA